MFLENLNSTVLAELRVFRQQYDQIWQSTVIELETQRDQSQREVLAVSARLTLLADEVIFQKRMSIVQSVLLLLCLGLVIFSRGFAGSYVDFPLGRVRSPALLRFGSPPESPDQMRSDSQDEDERGCLIHSNRKLRSSNSGASYIDRLSPISASSPTSDEDPAYIDAHHVSYTGEPRDISEFGLRASKSNSNEVTHTLPQEAKESNSHRLKTHDGRDLEYVVTDDVLDEDYDEAHDRSDEDLEACSTDNAGFFDELGADIMDERSAALPSPPLEQGKVNFVIARKPLPALPHE